MTPEQFRSLLTVLHRIADAFEEQNRLSARLIDENAARETERASRDERMIAWFESLRPPQEDREHE